MKTVKRALVKALIFAGLCNNVYSVAYSYDPIDQKHMRSIFQDEFHITIPASHTNLGLTSVLAREGHFYLNYFTSFIAIYGGALFLQLFDVHLTREQISKATQLWSAYYMGRELFRDFYYSEKRTLWDLIILAILTPQYWYHHRNIIEGTLVPSIKQYGANAFKHFHYTS